VPRATDGAISAFRTVVLSLGRSIPVSLFALATALAACSGTEEGGDGGIYDGGIPDATAGDALPEDAKDMRHVDANTFTDRGLFEAPDAGLTGEGGDGSILDRERDGSQASLGDGSEQRNDGGPRTGDGEAELFEDASDGSLSEDGNLDPDGSWFDGGRGDGNFEGNDGNVDFDGDFPDGADPIQDGAQPGSDGNILTLRDTGPVSFDGDLSNGFCGDGICDPTENPFNCMPDCGEPGFDGN